MRAKKLGLVALPLLVLAACGGEGARAPTASHVDLPAKLDAAIREEAIGDPARAIALYEDALDAAANAPGDPWQLHVEQAALDALVVREVGSLSEISEDGALVYRTRDATIGAKLEAIAARADDPFSRGLIARALLELAEHAGDAATSERWRSATGCATESTVVGPLTWTAVTGVSDPDPLVQAGARVEATYRGPGAFASPLAPLVVKDRGCAIDVGSTSVDGGVRDVIVDVSVPSPQTIGVSLRAHTAALLYAGGRVAIERAYERGGGEAARFARIDVSRAGSVRLVARVGLAGDGESVEIDAWDAHGKPLGIHAAAVGSAADVAIARVVPIADPSPKNDVERVALAAGALAAGDDVIAERATAEASARPGSPPELSLLYARAIDRTADLDEVHRAERARAAYERLLEAWPQSWEATLAHAVLAGVRRGTTEARMESLRDLDAHRAKVSPSGAPILDAFEAATAGHDQLLDRATAALARAAKALPGTAIVRDAARAAANRSGKERVAFDCATTADVDRGRFDCYDALRASGDRTGTARELDRLRTLFGARSMFLWVELREALYAGDMATATRAFDAMLPGERSLAARFATHGPDRAALLDLASVARDAPGSIPPLLRASGDDPAKPFAGLAERVVAEDHATHILPHAATAVLAHEEHYDVMPSGLVRFTMFDVRRVSGTADVEDNAQATLPDLDGRATLRVVRRRIHKPDGRILEPERAPNAMQGHANLAQLEEGDTVEVIYEGWSLPNDRAALAIDTPDLLPERTAVHAATIEVRVPTALGAAVWSHPMLGKPIETKDGAIRVLTWKVGETRERRIEAETPRTDREVRVSLSTLKWSDMAAALRETLASMDEHDPEVAKWAHEAAKSATKPDAIVSAIVDASGTAVKEASGAALFDMSLGRPDGAQSYTARTILAEHEGSRSWLVVRALRELGVPAEIVVAENEPFSADGTFPPHDGRFTRPLVVAHLVEGAAVRDVWIDADVPGPPLPAGRISPELRGRSALHADGTIAPLPTTAASAERDEIDLRLTLDENGDAHGSLAILLRGRAAQEFAEELVRIVGDERQRALRNVALAWVPRANVDEVTLSSSEGSWQVALRASLSVPGYAQSVGSGASRAWALPGLEPMHYSVPRPYVTTLGAAYASRGARSDALAVSHAVQYHVRRRIELPKGASLARTPGAFEVTGGVASASRKIGVDGSTIEDDFALSVATGTVPAAAYPAFVADAHRIDDGFLAGTRVNPPK